MDDDPEKDPDRELRYESVASAHELYLINMLGQLYSFVLYICM